jgi:hypothetical protein
VEWLFQIAAAAYNLVRMTRHHDKMEDRDGCEGMKK